MNAVFYKFKKNVNSTKQPNNSVANKTMTININDANTSIMFPIITVRPESTEGITGVDFITDFNYVRIDLFKRYYYITDWHYNANGLWSAFCKVDFLASWKDDIMNSPGYVTRSEKFNDIFIPDQMYQSSLTPVTVRNNTTSIFSPYPTLGTFVLGVVGHLSDNNPSAHPGLFGGVQYYMMNTEEFYSLIHNFLGFKDDSGNFITSPVWKFEEDMNFEASGVASLYNPLQYVVSCRFYPFKFNYTENTANRVPIIFGGWKAAGLGAYLCTRMFEELPYNTDYGNPISGYTHYTWGDIPISDVDALNNGYNPEDYPPYAPYADYALQTPWGTYSIDGNIIGEKILYVRELRRQQGHENDTAHIYWKLMLNLVTGNATLVLSDTNAFSYVDSAAVTSKHEFFRQDIQIGVDIPLMAQYENIKYDMQAGKNLLGSVIDIISGGMSTALGGISGNGGGMASGISQGIRGTGTAMFDMVDMIQGGPRLVEGSSQMGGNITPLVTTLTVQQTRFATTGRAPSLFGKPLKMYVSDLLHTPGTNTVNPFEGFVKMNVSKFNSDCTETESHNIINALQGGVYIE